MELLRQEPPGILSPFWLWEVLEWVWDQAPLYLTPLDADWREQLAALTGGPVPEMVVGAGDECRIHGDATVANLVFCPRTGEPRLVDPLPPGRRIPSRRGVDHAGALQSYLGWEVVVGAEPGHHHPTPPVMQLPDDQLRVAAWWMVAKCRRILPYASRAVVREWCERVEGALRDIIG